MTSSLPMLPDFDSSQGALYSTVTLYSHISGFYPSLDDAKKTTISQLTAYKESGGYEHEYIGFTATRGDIHVPIVFDRDFVSSKSDENLTINERIQAKKKTNVEATDQIRFPRNLPRSSGDQMTVKIDFASPIPLYFAAAVASLISEECPRYDLRERNCYFFTDAFLQLIQRLVGENGLTITLGTRKRGSWGGMAVNSADFPTIDEELVAKLLTMIQDFETPLIQKAEAAARIEEELGKCQAETAARIAAEEELREFKAEAAARIEEEKARLKKYKAEMEVRTQEFKAEVEALRRQLLVGQASNVA